MTPEINSILDMLESFYIEIIDLSRESHGIEKVIDSSNDPSRDIARKFLDWYSGNNTKIDRNDFEHPINFDTFLRTRR